jgi:4-hydroxy-tetrahydrodipicolinate reductase
MVLEAALTSSDIDVSAALTRAGHAWAGRDLGTCLGRLPMDRAVVDDPAVAFAGAQVVIDFTHPSATLSFLPVIARAKVPLVCGTTGFQPDELEAVKALSREVPVVLAANMSLGVNVLLELVQQASRLLGPEFDLEVLEIHHRHKKDSPSGTALALAEAGLAARSDRELRSALHVRSWGQTGPRRGADEVGVAALRGGDVVGEHTVYFLGTGERIELTHRATDRRAFAQGALRAARWIVDRPPGLYSMQDVLGLRG